MGVRLQWMFMEHQAQLFTVGPLGKITSKQERPDRQLGMPSFHHHWECKIWVIYLLIPTKISNYKTYPFHPFLTCPLNFPSSSFPSELSALVVLNLNRRRVKQYCMAMMQQGPQPSSCSCIATLFASPDTLFLTRKTPTQDSQGHVRNKSSELLLIENEGKPLKRSLRKRPASSSHIPVENFHPLAFLQHSPAPQLRIDFKPQPQTLNHEYSFSIIEDLPHSTARQSQQYQQFSPEGNDRSPSPGGKQQPYVPLPEQITPMTPLPSMIHRGSPQRFHPQSLPFLCHPLDAGFHYYQQQAPLQADPSKFSNTAQEGSPMPQEHISKVHYPLRCEQQQTQSWIPFPGREELLIEDFDRLFKNREEHQSHANLAQHRHGKAREAKRSKRLEKQLVGRLAESDDEGCSESAPSEVIGKGFESHFGNTFWEIEDGHHFEETLATRSTNTKMSLWQKGEHKFSPQHHFRSDSHI